MAPKRKPQISTPAKESVRKSARTMGNSAFSDTDPRLFLNVQSVAASNTPEALATLLTQASGEEQKECLLRLAREAAIKQINVPVIHYIVSQEGQNPSLTEVEYLSFFWSPPPNLNEILDRYPLDLSQLQIQSLLFTAISQRYVKAVQCILEKYQRDLTRDFIDNCFLVILSCQEIPVLWSSSLNILRQESTHTPYEMFTMLLEQAQRSGKFSEEELWVGIAQHAKRHLIIEELAPYVYHELEEKYLTPKVSFLISLCQGHPDLRNALRADLLDTLLLNTLSRKPWVPFCFLSLLFERPFPVHDFLRWAVATQENPEDLQEERRMHFLYRLALYSSHQIFQPLPALLPALIALRDQGRGGGGNEQLSRALQWAAERRVPRELGYQESYYQTWTALSASRIEREKFYAIHDAVRRVLGSAPSECLTALFAYPDMLSHKVAALIKAASYPISITPVPQPFANIAPVVPMQRPGAIDPLDPLSSLFPGLLPQEDMTWLENVGSLETQSASVLALSFAELTGDATVFVRPKSLILCTALSPEMMIHALVQRASEEGHQGFSSLHKVMASKLNPRPAVSVPFTMADPWKAPEVHAQPI